MSKCLLLCLVVIACDFLVHMYFVGLSFPVNTRNDNFAFLENAIYVVGEKNRSKDKCFSSFRVDKKGDKGRREKLCELKKGEDLIKICL